MKKIQLYLVIILIPAVLIPLFLFSCLKSNNGEKIKFDTIVKGLYSEQKEKEYFVIKDKDSLNRLLAKIMDSSPDANARNVNFNEEMVIAVFMGEKATGGFSIEVVDVLEQKDYVAILIKTVKPDPGQMVTEAITSPYHIIKLKRYDMEFLFNILEV
jgi:hypothetical protein